MDPKDKRASVYRISVDERLSEDLIRLEICELIKYDESGEFRDEPDFWEDIVPEEGEIVARLSIMKNENTKGLSTNLMSIIRSLGKQIPWKEIREGQVFLLGEFEVKADESGGKTVNRYFIRSGEEAFFQIDKDVKENTKALYYGILAKGEENGTLYNPGE